MNETELWDAYDAQPQEDGRRNALVEHYLPLVKRLAGKVYGQLAGNVDLDDLVSTGVIGLMGSIESFDRDRGVKFSTYCQLRVRGAMLDFARESDPVSRVMRGLSRRLDRAAEIYFAQHGRHATIETLAARVGVAADRAIAATRAAAAGNLDSLDRVVFNGSERGSTRVCDLLAAKPESAADRFLRRDMFREVARGLRQDDRLLLILYYFEGLSMRQVGEQLGISESRVSQRHSQLLAFLRKRSEAAPRPTTLLQTSGACPTQARSVVGVAPPADCRHPLTSHSQPTMQLRTIFSGSSLSGDLQSIERSITATTTLAYLAVGRMFREIRERGLWRDGGYESFNDYLLKRWDNSPRHAYRMINAWEVANSIYQMSSGSVELPDCAGQTRQLMAVENHRERLEVWELAVDAAPAGPKRGKMLRDILKRRGYVGKSYNGPKANAQRNAIAAATSEPARAVNPHSGEIVAVCSRVSILMHDFQFDQAKQLIDDFAGTLKTEN